MAYAEGVAYLVDVRTNALDWYYTYSQKLPADGAWDEPPQFPGLTNAYFQVLEATRTDLVSALSRPPEPAATASASSASPAVVSPAVVSPAATPATVAPAAAPR